LLRLRGRARDQVDRFIPITFPYDSGINISHSYSQLLCGFGNVQWRRNFSSSTDYGDAGVLNRVRKSITLSSLHSRYCILSNYLQHHYTHSFETEQNIISLADSGNIAKAEDLLNQMQVDAVSNHRRDMLPDIESYTALMDA
jgi:hypothetical protein